ncbi:MAG: HEAT repeat domain-containing protein [Fimbriimonas sp.]
MRKEAENKAEAAHAALRKARDRHQAAAAVAPLRALPPAEAVGFLVTLMGDFGDWSWLLADEVERLVLAHPSLAMRQRLDVGKGLLEGKAREVLTRQSHRWAVVAVMTQHFNGYIREEAIRRLIEMHETRALAFALNRQSDWVPEVSEAANLAYFRLSQGANAPVDESAWLWALATRDRERGGGRAFLERLLDDPEARIVAVTGSVKVAKFLLSTVPALTEADPLWEAALSSPYGVVRAEAARRFQPGGNLAWAARLAKDPSPEVRSIALGWAATGNPVREILEDALLDRNEGLRAQARILLGPGDYAAYYRSKIPIPAAIEGLGATGTRADAEVLLPFLTSPVPRVRRATVRAIARLDARGATAAVQDRLSDPSARVVREAVQALRKLNASVDRDSLEAFLRLPGRPIAARRATLNATELMSRWEAATLLLDFARDPDLNDAVRVHLVNWAERMQYLVVRPRPEVRDLFERRLANAPLPRDLTFALRAQAHRWN